MPPGLDAAMSWAAYGHSGSAGYTLVVPLLIMAVLVVSAVLARGRHRAHSRARRNNPPSEADGSKAQPPAEPGRKREER